MRESGGEDEDEDEERISRDELLMKRFLEGKLHVGSSMLIKRAGQKLSFALDGTEAKRMSGWWNARGTHVSSS